jgi:hypothetical protein
MVKFKINEEIRIIFLLVKLVNKPKIFTLFFLYFFVAKKNIIDNITINILANIKYE